MAIKGLSIPVVGDYNVDENGNVTYSNPIVANKAVEYSASWETTDDNPLYADNNIVEQDSGTFQSGTLTLGTADLEQSLSERLLGLKKVDVTFGNNKTATELVYDDNAKSPYLGFGIIELHQIDNEDKYRAVFLPKINFKIPEEAATTKGDSIDWQTKSIEANINRSDQVDEHYKHPWLIDAWFDSESDALMYLYYKCGQDAVSAASLNDDAED